MTSEKGQCKPWSPGWLGLSPRPAQQQQFWSHEAALVHSIAPQGSVSQNIPAFFFVPITTLALHHLLMRGAGVRPAPRPTSQRQQRAAFAEAGRDTQVALLENLLSPSSGDQGELLHFISQRGKASWQVLGPASPPCYKPPAPSGKHIHSLLELSTRSSHNSALCCLDSLVTPQSTNRIPARAGCPWAHLNYRSPGGSPALITQKHLTR